MHVHCSSAGLHSLVSYSWIIHVNGSHERNYQLTVTGKHCPFNYRVFYYLVSMNWMNLWIYCHFLWTREYFITDQLGINYPEWIPCISTAHNDGQTLLPTPRCSIIYVVFDQITSTFSGWKIYRRSKRTFNIWKKQITYSRGSYDQRHRDLQIRSTSCPLRPVNMAISLMTSEFSSEKKRKEKKA